MFDSGDSSDVSSDSGTEFFNPKTPDSASRQRHAELRQFPFFELEVLLKGGRNLVAKDTCGTSDPYVKFKVDGKMLYKSKTIYKTLNPDWNERFTLPIEDAFQPVYLKVYDYDWGLQDDFMGSAYLELTALEPFKASDVILTLSDPGKNDDMGQILLTVTLVPKSQQEKEQYFHRSVKGNEASKKLKSQIWSSVVTIVLIEGRSLSSNAPSTSASTNIAPGPSLASGSHTSPAPSSPNDENLLPSPFIRFRLGNEKYKSKSARRSGTPVWREQFDLHMYEDQSKLLEITACDASSWQRDDVIGRATIDLSSLDREKTHRIWKDLDDAGAIFLLLTISGTTNTATIADLTTSDVTETEENETITNQYSLLRTFQNTRDIGHLTVKVYQAENLASADIGGKSDPFCVLELVNARLQTQTEYKTLCPTWNKVFTFNVKDIHSELEVTVYDEDRDHKVEFLGKVAIPLLRVQNGVKKWYVLKDKKLQTRAKGRILLELNVIFNPGRACIRTFNPREKKYMQQEEKFQRKIFINNVMRVRSMIMTFIDIWLFIQSCWEWESPVRSVAAFVVFELMTYYFESWMAPAALLGIFLWYALKYGTTPKHLLIDEVEEKKTLKEKLQAIQDVTLTVQKGLGRVASVWESVKNTFNFTVPFLSWLAIIVLSLGVVGLYLIPLRYLLMIWGVNKFTRKLRNPDNIPNNEILDFLSRVPDDEKLIEYRELRPLATEPDKKSHKKKKST